MNSASFYKTAGTFAAFCLLFALTAFPSVTWAQVGYVHEVSGAVAIQKTLGKSGAANVGDTFEPGTILSTGINGKATVKFADGQIMVLSSDSIVRIGQYRFDAKNVKQSGSALVLSKGEMRFVTGVIGTNNPEGIRITAGLSTVGILKPGGADFMVRVSSATTVGANAGGPQEIGLAASAIGEIFVRTPYGVIEKVAPNQMVPWQPGRAIAPPTPIGAAPAIAQAAATAMFATVIPANGAVDVVPAASAAAFTSFATFATNPPQAEVSAGSKFSFSDLATVLAALPATAAGPAQAQVVSAPAQLQIAASTLPAPGFVYAGGFPIAAVNPPVTPGGGGRCTGSGC